MSSNFSKFDMLFSVEPGKKLTKAQLIENYERLKKQNKIQGSIFNEDMEGVIDEMFEVLNIEKAQNEEEDELLDETEVAVLKSYFDDGDENSKISENDFNELKKRTFEQINKKIESMDIESIDIESIDADRFSEQMYEKALKAAGGDMSNSSYIMDLSDDIETLNSMIVLRQINSDDKIRQLEQQINELIQKKESLSDKAKKKYNKMLKESEDLQKQITETNAKIRANEQRIKALDLEEKVIQKQLESMSDEEKETLLKQKNSELLDIQKERDSLTRQNNDFRANLSKYESKQETLKSQMSDIMNEDKSNGKNTDDQISSLELEIKTEKLNCQNDIDKYTKKIALLNKVKDYAVEHISYASKSGYDFSQNTNNAISLDELLNNPKIQYSSTKGQMLASDVYSHRVGFTKHCSAYVSNGLARTKLGNERAGSAADMDDKLRHNKNFVEVKITSREQLRSLPAGCIVVYERGAAHYNAKHGHIEVTMGNGTAVSDGVTRNMRYSENMSVFVPVEQA